MAENEKLNITIVGNEASWEMRLEGDINGTYIGTFKFRCFLTPTQKIMANKEYRELLGPQMTMAGEHESFLAYALTQLKHRIISAPPFWNTQSILNGDLPDENIISAVLDAAVSAELTYKNQLQQRKLDAIEKAKKAAERMLNAKGSSDEESPEENDN